MCTMLELYELIQDLRTHSRSHRWRHNNFLRTTYIHNNTIKAYYLQYCGSYAPYRRRRTPDDGHWTQEPKHHTISSQVSLKGAICHLDPRGPFYTFLKCPRELSSVAFFHFPRCVGSYNCSNFQRLHYAILKQKT